MLKNGLTFGFGTARHFDRHSIYLSHQPAARRMRRIYGTNRQGSVRIE
jgi:hypothetical protein